jgi:hypothetical protein
VLPVRARLRCVPLITTTLAVALLGVPRADAVGGAGTGTRGQADGSTLSASASYSRIKVTQVSGPTGGKRGTVSSTNVNWKPPPCWYEPVFSPAQLKDFSENNGDGDAGLRNGWYGSKLWTDHFRDEKDAITIFTTPQTVKGYKNYNLGKDGYFWRGVAPDGLDAIDDTSLCSRLMFWVPAGQIPKVENAPKPQTLAEYAYDQIKVPSTEIEVKPAAKSTVNLPTWVWLDKGRFKEVKVRAELPDTGLWAETTAKPVALHLNPGTQDATTYPASANCTINDDGSIGSPYEKGDADKTPPCGITYLHATNGTPYHLKASITWQITWEGSDGSKGDLPDGTFETTQDMNVQEIQSVNR